MLFVVTVILTSFESLVLFFFYHFSLKKRLSKSVNNIFSTTLFYFVVLKIFISACVQNTINAIIVGSLVLVNYTAPSYIYIYTLILQQGLTKLPKKGSDLQSCLSLSAVTPGMHHQPQLILTFSTAPRCEESRPVISQTSTSLSMVYSGLSLRSSRGWLPLRMQPPKSLDFSILARSSTW